ncbi:hypothetical protein N0V93_010151 [Gnomoniopsis smithogilvyi]|uniref:Kelch repeat protein n=1 Tax=Gnomoniopsis smithogilvyi TaxID=1191159 RepID=A0A9W9CT48_9PEZI|nr:hypothetical protein N0V93_010151 [Gnomoniopsis smithogilvyi]
MFSLPILAGLASVGVAQYSGWDVNNGQNSSTMCTWERLRAAVVRDTVYMDGGELFWTPGYNDGSFQQPVSDPSPFGTSALALNLSEPFDVSQNISALFTSVYKGASANLYYDGAMLANNYEWFLYGGMTLETNTMAPESSNEVWEYQIQNYGNDETAFAAGFKTYEIDRIGNISTRYIAYGGAANVPSENLSFYFSGLRSPSWGEILPPNGNLSSTAVNVSNTLISLDFSTQNQESFTNSTLPSTIPGRANPELVWVPVGEQGILVALGGVVDPAFVSVGGLLSPNATASVAQSPAFMTNIDIYDIANEVWYTQSTTGSGPGQLTEGCAVMQPAADYSSFNIYWYGGYNGLNLTVDSAWNDAIWVLSLPSFTWKQVSDARTGKARAGHKCVMPYPDQMLVIGGNRAQSGGSTYECLTEIIQLFNVSSATWLDSYDPSVWSNYSVPSAVFEVIGGDKSGGATVTAPSSWDDTALGDVFQVAYATSKITTYYPYPAATSTAPGTSSPSSTSSNNSGGSSVPSFLPPLLGVLLGLILISSIAVGILLWRRRRLLKKNGGISVASDNEHGGRIMSWINGQPQPSGAKSETVTTSDEVFQPGSPDPNVGLRYTQQPAFGSYYEQQHARSPHEISSNEMFELPATPSPAELSDAPMTPSAIVQRTLSSNHTRDASSFGWSSMQATDQGSMVSSTSIARNAPGPPPPPSSTSHGGASSVAGYSSHPVAAAATTENKELPELPSGSPRGDSGVSAFSERERSHLRNTSDPATVSTMDAVIAPPRSQTMAGNRVASPPILEEGALEAANKTQPSSVVSPPTDGTAEGEDYIGARTMHGVLVSPVEARTEPPRPGSRKSAFRESAEDLGGEGSS